MIDIIILCIIVNWYRDIKSNSMLTMYVMFMSLMYINVQSNFNGSNTFGKMQISSRQG